VVGVHDVITPLKFGDDRFRGFWLAKGQSLHFPIYFEGRPYNGSVSVIITSAKEVMFLPEFVCLSVRLSVCVLAR